MKRAELIHWQKARIQDRYLIETAIWGIPVSARYPDGIKYRLLFLDEKTKRRILMDNHHPKGPHIHLNDQQVGYVFVDDDKLLEDFARIVFDHMGVKL